MLFNFIEFHFFLNQINNFLILCFYLIYISIIIEKDMLQQVISNVRNEVDSTKEKIKNIENMKDNINTETIVLQKKLQNYEEKIQTDDKKKKKHKANFLLLLK